MQLMQIRRVSARRGLFVAAAAGAAMVTLCVTVGATTVTPVSALRQINHMVVIYEENHSFDNLYGGWEGVDGRANADPAHSMQVNQDGTPFACLRQVDVNLTSPPLAESCTDTTTGESFTSAFTNQPFEIDALIPPTATTCPKPGGAPAPDGLVNGTGLPGGCTRDMVHRFYREQFQLDGGKQDRYVIGSDALGLAMGYYDTKSLPIYAYLHMKGHPSYAITDRFFQGAFGGSFLNHQWLIAAATPVWPKAPNDGSDNDLHSVVDANGMPKDKQLTLACNQRPAALVNLACGDYAVNNVQPWYQPSCSGTACARRIPPLTRPTIGNRLSAKGIDWAWYSGGWSNADGAVNAPGWTNGSGPKCSDPNALDSKYPHCPDVNFQCHHQPLNYYAKFAPGTAARTRHLRDEVEFETLAQASAKQCRLKAVSFIKPIGEKNEHPGYASEVTGSDHLVQLLKLIEGSACAKDTMVVVTYDEFGGQWDHVPPPGQGTTTPGPHDEWGPGTRIPTLVLAPHLAGSFVVDHTSHDTTSILATIEHRWGLAPLGPRDAAVADLSSVFAAKEPGDK